LNFDIVYNLVLVIWRFFCEAKLWIAIFAKEILKKLILKTRKPFKGLFPV